jgi:ABC-type glycerol-3-phosphate transport system substrate-binding protein
MTLYTRREALRMALSTVGAVYLASCSSKGQSTTNGVDLLYDWTYNGPPGKVADFWGQVRTRLASEGQGPHLGELSEVPFESLVETIQTQNKAKSGATLVTYYQDYVNYKYVRDDVLDPMDDFLGKDEKAHWLLSSSKFNGKTWAAPLAIELVVLAVNRKHLESAGVNVDVQFDSYDHFIEACDRLNAAGITPLEAGTSDALGAERWLMFEQLQVIESPADLLRGVIGEISIDDPVFSRPRERIPVFRDKYMNKNPSDDTDQMATDRFFTGSAGMALTFISPLLAPGLGSEYDIVGFPKSTARFNRPAIATGDCLYITNYGDNQEDAAKILSFIHQPEQTSLWWQLTQNIPCDDRFDSSLLPPPGKRIWDFIMARPGDPYALWWLDNFYPISPGLEFYYGVTQALFAGGTAEQARAQTEELFTKFQKQNPGEVEIVREFLPIIDQLVGSS